MSDLERQQAIAPPLRPSASPASPAVRGVRKEDAHLPSLLERRERWRSDNLPGPTSRTEGGGAFAREVSIPVFHSAEGLGKGIDLAVTKEQGSEVAWGQPGEGSR